MFHRCRWLLGVLVAGSIMIPLLDASTLPAVRFTEARLRNGLRVVLAEDHTAPVFSIAVTYRVGSRDERKTRTGVAHLFEHLMFKGSENVGPGEHFMLVFQHGGTMNGTTNKDRTLYYETLPARQLELALFLEADRMRSLAITPENLDNQRSAVKEERRVRFDNQPYGKTDEALDQLAYDNFAYAHSVIGSMADLDAASVPDVASFFRTYYAPNNAVVAIVGDIDAQDCLARVRHYFESIPSQPAPPAVDLDEPPQQAARWRAVTDPLATLTRLDIAFKTPPSLTQDDDAMRALSTIVGGGRSSRLYARVVLQEALASAVTTSLSDNAGPTLFRVTATVAPGQSPEALESAIDTEIARLQAEPVASWELDKARAAARRAFITSLQSSSSRAILLGQYALFQGDPGLINTRATRIESVMADDVLRAARRYLVASNRSVVTTSKGDAPTQTAGQSGSGSSSATDAAVVMKGRAPVADVATRVKLPRPQTFDLPNGLHVIVLEDRRVPLVSFNLVIAGAGSYFDPPDRPGLASFTAAMLREGTATRSADDLARQLETLSASIDASSDAGSPDATIAGVCLTEHLPAVMDVLADMLLHPTFPDRELRGYQQRTRASLMQQRSNPGFLANELFAQLVNGSHPAARTSATVESLAATTSAHLAEFHRTHYVPNGAALAIAGDLSIAEARAIAGARLGGWRRVGQSTHAVTDPADPPADGSVHVVERAHSVQTFLMVGAPAISRANPDFEALQVMNQVIGAGPTGRLFVHLREQKGYTYGAFSTLNAGQYRGAWIASTAVRSDVTGPALQDLLSDIARLRDQPVPADELRRQQESMLASFALSLESPKQLLGYALTQWTYRLPADYWDRYPARIMAVTPADVQRVARKYLEPSALRIVAVGDPPHVRDELKALQIPSR